MTQRKPKVTQILYSTSLLLGADGAIIMAGELYSHVLSLSTSVKKIAKRSDLPFEISSRKVLKI